MDFSFKLILTTKYDDLILKYTSNWKHTNAIVAKVGGDKSAIILAIQRLVEMNLLQNSTNKNKILYKRKNTVQSEFDFISMMSTFEINQKIELNRLQQIPTLMMLDGQRLRAKGIALMDHILEEVNRAYVVKIRLNFQMNSYLISSTIAEKRIKKLDDYIEKIMHAIMNKHAEKTSAKVIQNYFQQHGIKFDFNI